MIRLPRRWTALVLSFALSATPALAEVQAGAVALPPPTSVTPETLQKAAAWRESPEFFQAKLAPKLESLKKPAVGVGRFVNEIIQVQALVILMAAASYQATREHGEMVRLNGGAQLPGEQAAPADWCEARGGGGAIEAMLCSGEFFMGILGAGGFVAGNTVGAWILRSILQNTSRRLAFVRVLGSMVSASLMMAGASASAQLWSEAVKSLPKKEMIEQAHGVFGRAALAMKRGQWQAFKSSSDGELFQTILSKMYDILRADNELRSQWIYNTWRFGIARGEFISAMAAIMGGSAVGAGAAGVAAAAGFTLTAPIAGFIVCSAFGFVLMDFVFTGAVPRSFTALLQNTRQFLDAGQMNRARQNIKILSYGFATNRYPQADDPGYVKVYQQYYDTYMTQETQAREAWTNVGIEKFYELASEERALAMKIELAKTAIQNQDLQKKLYFDVNGQILTYQAAQEKLCAAGSTCQMGADYQLKALDQMKPQVAQAEVSLAYLAREIVGQYRTDATLIDGIFQNSKLIFHSPDIILQLTRFKDMAQALGAQFQLVLSGLSETVRQDQGVTMNTQPDPKTGHSELSEWQDFAREQLSIYYTHSFREADVYQSLQGVGGLK